MMCAMITDGAASPPPEQETKPSLQSGTSPVAPESTLLPPPYASDIQPLSAALRAALTATSWQPQCPVALDDLRVVTLMFVDFDGGTRQGLLIVHADVAAEAAAIFGDLYAARFPLYSVRPVHEFGGDDNASMAANNTSGFNCRPNATHSGQWSRHAFGRAIDLNPVQNPYVVRGRVHPSAARDYLDRTTVRPGMILPEGVVHRAFRERGWRWGGLWRRVRDWQHFEKP